MTACRVADGMFHAVAGYYDDIIDVRLRHLHRLALMFIWLGWDLAAGPSAKASLAQRLQPGTPERE